jgi:hypothetical protein
MIDEDLDAYLADHGVPCSCGTVDFVGILDQPDDELAMGGMHAQSTMSSLLVKTSDVAAVGIKYGTTLIVNTVAYSAHNPAMEGDGAFSRMLLSKVTP